MQEGSGGLKFWAHMIWVDVSWFLMWFNNRIHYTFYTRTTQNGETVANTYVDLRENPCKTDFEESLSV